MNNFFKLILNNLGILTLESKFLMIEDDPGEKLILANVGNAISKTELCVRTEKIKKKFFTFKSNLDINAKK